MCRARALLRPGKKAFAVLSAKGRGTLPTLGRHDFQEEFWHFPWMNGLPPMVLLLSSGDFSPPEAVKEPFSASQDVGAGPFSCHLRGTSFLELTCPERPFCERQPDWPLPSVLQLPAYLPRHHPQRSRRGSGCSGSLVPSLRVANVKGQDLASNCLGHRGPIPYPTAGHRAVLAVPQLCIGRKHWPLPSLHAELVR